MWDFETPIIPGKKPFIYYEKKENGEWAPVKEQIAYYIDRGDGWMQVDVHTYSSAYLFPAEGWKFLQINWIYPGYSLLHDRTKLEM
jgi:hypothetical protein